MVNIRVVYEDIWWVYEGHWCCFMAIFVDVENMGCYHEILGLGMAICLNFCRFFEDLLAMCKAPLEEILWDRYDPTCICWFNIGICRQEWELKFEVGMN